MIVRAERRTNYTIISNVGLRDERLSYKARGLLAYLLSMPDNWRCNERHLSQHAPDGRDSVASGLRELEAGGYLLRQKTRLENGTFGWHSVIYDEPVLDSSAPENPHASAVATPDATNGKPTAGKTDRGSTNHGKASHIRKTHQSTTKSSKTNRDQDDDADDALRSALVEVGVKPTAATLRHYREQVTRFGLATVLAGLERAAAHGKADVRAYVGKCIASAATGEQDPDAARRRQYIPAEYADIIRG